MSKNVSKNDVSKAAADSEGKTFEAQGYESMQHEIAALKVDVAVRDVEISDLKERAARAEAHARDLAAQLENLRARARSAKRRGRLAGLFRVKAA